MVLRKAFDARYNARRYSKPWDAIVKFGKNLKPVYDFAGHWGGVEVVMMAEAGDVVAFGQKDNRGNGTTRRFYIVGSDGELEPASEGRARDFFLSRGGSQ